MPHIQMLQEDNVSSGFFEPGEFKQLPAHLPHDLEPLFRVTTFRREERASFPDAPVEPGNGTYVMAGID